MSEQDKMQPLATNDELLASKIFIIREQKVMLDRDLAELYGVTTGNLNKAVKRNIKRFPEDFMFQLSEEESQNLIFQFGTSSWGGIRKPPFAFTEQGVAMLSGVLHSDRAIAVNIQIMRIFTRMRKLLADHTKARLEIVEIKNAVETISKKQSGQDKMNSFLSTSTASRKRSRSLLLQLKGNVSATRLVGRNDMILEPHNLRINNLRSLPFSALYLSLIQLPHSTNH